MWPRKRWWKGPGRQGSEEAIRRKGCQPDPCKVSSWKGSKTVSENDGVDHEEGQAKPARAGRMKAACHEERAQAKGGRVTLPWPLSKGRLWQKARQRG